MAQSRQNQDGQSAALSPDGRTLHRVRDDLSYKLLEKVLFDQRYVLIAAYLGLAGMLVSYAAYSVYHSALYCIEIWSGDESQATLGMLSGLDGVMVANVVYLISAGSYLVYVRGRVDNMTFEKAAERPPALRGLTSTSLKERFAASLVGVSAVNLLSLMLSQSGVLVHDSEHITWMGFIIKIFIHVALLAGLLVFIHASKHESAHEDHTAGAHDTRDATGSGSGHDGTHAAPVNGAVRHNGTGTAGPELHPLKENTHA